MDMMSDKDLLQYIIRKRYSCSDCINLRERVIKYGLEEINKYEGMICKGVEDMFIRSGRW